MVFWKKKKVASAPIKIISYLKNTLLVKRKLHALSVLQSSGSETPCQDEKLSKGIGL